MAWYQELARLVCCLVLLAPLGSSQSFQEYGVVYANTRAFLFVGEGIDLYCNITNKEVRENSSMLHFERNTREGQSIVPTEYMEILSTKAVRLRLRNLALDDDGVYTCFQETFSGDSRVLGSQTINIDNKPQSVKEMSCRVHNWNHMKCTWSLGVKFQHPEYIKVSLVWTIHGEQKDCPKLTSTSCLWDAKAYTHGYLYLMVLEVATVVEGKELMHVRSPQFKIDTILYVEPAPVNNLQATVESSTCVYLTWQHSSADWLKFFVAESRVKGKDKWNQIILDQEQEQEDYHSAVCNLIPFTDYDFRMSVLPFPVETSEPVVQGFKSEWKTVSAKTLEDVPTTAPHICSSCFHDYKCPHKKLHRCVRLYWQSLKENEKCGILTAYNITYTNTDTGATHSSLLPVTESSPQQSADLELPSASQSFQIFITPGTSQGFSRSSSSLFLQPVSKKPNPPTSFLVEWDVDKSIRFYLSWAALNVDPKTGMKYSNVSVVWCCGQRQRAECESDLNWVRLPADHVTYELQPEKKDCLDGDYLIGVTAETVHDGLVTSSGIQWSSCVYLRNQMPQNSPKNVRQSPTHPKNGLTIQWDNTKCQEKDSFITEYLVFYCPLYEDNTCMESEKSQNISNAAAEVTLNHLKEDIRYKVNVVAVSSAGLGPSNPIVTEAVKGSPLPEPEIDRSIGIIVGVVSFIILVGIVIALWRYCFYLKKKVSNTENLIQPYAQTSENYTTKKLEDIRTRPLPKTPEDQHFYGSSACMSIHGSEKAKSSRVSKKSADESVMSQSNLLLKLFHTTNNASTRKTRAKRSTKKDAGNKVSKEKNFPFKETKALLDRNSSMSSNDSNYLNEVKKPYQKKVPLLTSNLSAIKPTGTNISITHNPGPANVFTSANIVQSSSRRLNKCPHMAIGDFVDHSEISDPCIINFSKTSTLFLRRHSMEQPYHLSLAAHQHDPYSSSAQENHKMAVDFGQGVPCTKHVQNNSFYTWKPQQPHHNCHCLASATKNLQTSVNYQNCASPSGCLISDHAAHSDASCRKTALYSPSNNVDYPRSAEIVEIKRHSVPLESFLYYPPLTSPPSPPCTEEMQYAHHSLSHHHMPPEYYCSCQSPLSPRSRCPASSEVPDASVTNHLLHQQFITCPSQATLPENLSLTPQNKGRLVHPPSSLHISPASSPAAYLDAYPYARSFSNDGLVDNSQYNAAVSSHTFPRNACKDSNILHLPSPMSRPLSGDLLDLPPEYYQDPQLDGSNQILTEL